MRRALAILAIAIAGVSPARAQTVLDPTTAEFQPSPDHDVTTPEGAAWVTSYLLQIFPTGSSTPSFSIDMGKPAPAADGWIRFEFASRLTSPLVPGSVYQARVTAIGPGGTAASAVSNAFSSSVVCAPSISASSASFGASASKGSVSVTAAAGCAWSATTADTWLAITSGGSGTGSLTVSFTVSANNAAASRTGTLTIAGKPFTVTQAGACLFTLKPGNLSVPAQGLISTLAVDTGAGCSWSASNMPSWVTMPSATQTGPGILPYTIAANPGTARAVTLTIAGQPFVVNQNAAAVLPPANVRIIRNAPE
jgi:hypothetical protein